MPHFDYIIIGAGSAGCVLANRLSADPGNKVLLLEAGGPDNSSRIMIPGRYPELHQSRYNWKFWSEPQKFLNNRRLFLPRGKTLGGSSSVNAMAYIRGNPADFDEWEAMGSKNWAYKDLLPYFIKSENNADAEKLDTGFHGTAGELHVSYMHRYQTPFSEAFIESGLALGLERNNDHNGIKQEGIGRFQFNIKNGKRWSAATAFLRPAMKRENLKVITNARVHRIHCSKNEAESIEFADRYGSMNRIRCRREILLCAGSFQSPQLLMLSGIGDADYLKSMNIDCINHLPGVGRNLQDHVFFNISATSIIQKGLNHLIKPRHKIIALAKYLILRRGPLCNGPIEATAFFNLDDLSERADFQLHFTAFHINTGYNNNLYNIKSFPTYDGFSILPTLVNPRSRGFVRLRSTDPTEPPIIQPNLLSHEKDTMQCIKGARFAIKMLEQFPFDPFRKDIVAPPIRESDEEIIDHIRKTAETIYHPVGTCKMGHDEMSVVNDRLQVHGIGNLRVVDASIMPRIVTGNTNAVVYCIAEKAADMILGN